MFAYQMSLLDHAHTRYSEVHTGQPFDSLYTASLQKLNTLTVSTPRSLFGIIVDLLTFGLCPLL